jgi:hypothetical protein
VHRSQRLLQTHINLLNQMTLPHNINTCQRDSGEPMVAFCFPKGTASDISVVPKSNENR